MKKHILFAMSILLLMSSGCTMFKGALDKRTGFSTELVAVKDFICEEDWEKAGESMTLCMQKWNRVKPWMQLELDHDVINEMETRLVELSAYLETEEKPAALADIYVIINYWDNAGSK